MSDGKMKRRDVVRAVPVAILVTAVGGLGRALLACSDDPKKLEPASNGGNSPTKPTDGDEYTPPNGNPPVNAGDEPPKVPNPAWESRAKQLEDEQMRQYGVAIFTKAAPGIYAGKERSHVPEATAALEGKYKRATVQVLHVMGKNGLDAGPMDAAIADAKPDVLDAGADAAKPDAAKPDAEAGAPVDAGTPIVHYITTIFIRALVNGNQTVVGLYEFASTDAAPPTVKFTLPVGTTSIEAYEWCTLHGLWKSDPLTVP